MATLTIRRLDDEVKRRLRMRAAARGHSMEEEVRQLLHEVLMAEPAETGGTLARRIHARFAAHGGVELDELPHRPLREPPEFDR